VLVKRRGLQGRRTGEPGNRSDAGFVVEHGQRALAAGSGKRIVPIRQCPAGSAQRARQCWRGGGVWPGLPGWLVDDDRTGFV
jgi:hypothetical protein